MLGSPVATGFDSGRFSSDSEVIDRNASMSGMLPRVCGYYYAVNCLIHWFVIFHSIRIIYVIHLSLVFGFLYWL